MSRLAFVASVIALFCGSHPALAGDPAFTQFIASLWPEAQAAGVSRATFDAETRGREPDYKLPDLLPPGPPPTATPAQAQSAQVPAAHADDASIARLAAERPQLTQTPRAALNAIASR